MKRPKGPELKVPPVKPPAFLIDLYHDLRDRRLLPLMALVVVAIAAVPFLLGDSAEEELALPASGDVSAALESAKERSASLTVVEAKPGLRDYRKRLGSRTPTDPFKQGFTSGSLKGAQLNEKKGGGSGSKGKGETTSTSTTDGSSADGGSPPPSAGSGAPGESPPADSPPSTPPKGSGGPGKGELVFYAFAINVRIVKSVDGKQGEPVVRERVLPQTPLPGEKQPVITYMGPARNGDKANGKALLLVSDQVTEVAGDANCVFGDEICQLLEVEPGFPVVLTYGEGGAKYTINVLKQSLVITGRQNFSK